MKKFFSRTLLAATAALCAAGVHAYNGVNPEDRALVTKYPVVLAHGMTGFDSLGGFFNYFGNDDGVFVGENCATAELACNWWLHAAQGPKTEAFQVTSLHNSEVRGTELYNHVRSYMATTGAAKVNLIGHSQGGFDIRKAAALLKAHFGTPSVGAMISVSSPHRGSPYAKKILDMYARNNDGAFCRTLPVVDGVDPCGLAIQKISDNLFDFLTGGSTAGNDVIAGGLALIYDDYDPNDGVITGTKAFNNNYDGQGVADYVGSIVTGQDNSDMNPVLGALHTLLGMNADGDGYCGPLLPDDCDNDGAAGAGDGITHEMDDDGLVGINSQQMGYRLRYTQLDGGHTLAPIANYQLPLDDISEITALGYVTDINRPSSEQMTSMDGVVSQDHLDVIALGPDTFDEHELYAGLFNFIASKGY